MTTELATTESTELSQDLFVEDDHNMLMDTKKFNHLLKISEVFAKSELVPDQFRNKPENCFVALQFAFRAGIEPFGFLQKCYVIHGKPAIEAQLAVTLLYKSRLTVGPINYEFDGTGAKYGCTASVIDKQTGEVVKGPKID